MTEGERGASIWSQADEIVLAIGIYMERYRIGWFSARAELDDEAARNGITISTLAKEIVQRLDQRRT